MKNLKIGITILFIGLTTLAQAQERQSKEKIEAIKIAYLTEKNFINRKSIESILAFV